MVRSRGILIQRAMHVVVRQQASNSPHPVRSPGPYRAGDTATVTSACLPGSHERPVGSNVIAPYLCAARPVSSEVRHDFKPHAAVSGSARQTAPGPVVGQDSRVIST